MASHKRKFLTRLSRLLTTALLLISLCLVSPAILSADPPIAVEPPLTSESPVVFPSPATGSYVEVSYIMPSAGTAHVYIYNEAGDLAAEQSNVQSIGLQKSILNLYYFRRGVYICRVVIVLDTGEVKKLKLFKFAVIR